MAKAKTPRPDRRERRAAARAAARAKTRAEAKEQAASSDAGSPEALHPPAPGRTHRTFASASRRAVAGAATLAFLVAACYFPALSGGFVWDDRIFVEEPVIHRWSGLASIWFSPSDIRGEAHYWPIVYTTFWLEHKLWGLAPLGYHVVNVLLHLVNTLLVWRLLLLLAVPGAWAVAAVFAVHPLHVESVAWIIERKDLLSTAFYLTAVLAWVRFNEAPHIGRYLLALALFTAGLLSKSMVVTLPAALLVWHWWRHGRVTAADTLRLVPFFVLGLGITAADLAYYTSREPLALGYSEVERVLIAARALWFYAGKLLWPTDLAVIYPLWEIRDRHLFGWLHVAAAAGLAALLWFARHRVGRGPLAGALFFAVTLSPVLGFVDYGYMQFSFVADRFQYLAGLGLMAALIAGITRGVIRRPKAFRIGASAVLVVVLALLGTLTWRQAGIYRDPITFFSHIVALNPQARNAHYNLGVAYIDVGRFEEGYAAILVAVELRPDYVKSHNNLGSALLNLGRYAEAEKYLSRALELRPDYVKSHNNLGSTLLHLGRYDEAEKHLFRALELDPRNATSSLNMAVLRREQGRHEEAIEWFRKGIEKDPANAHAHADLGTTLNDAGRYEEAVASIDRALDLAPGPDQARLLLLVSARALKALGRFGEAERRLRRAAEMDPSDAASLVDLAELRIAEERFDEADEYLRRALALAPGNTAALQIVAEVLRERGQYEKAIESYRAVLAIDPDFAMAHAGMGDALIRLERYEEAIASLDRSLELNPRPPTAAVRLLLLGNASQALGRPEAAAEYFERALELDPRNYAVIDRLAGMRFKAKRYDEALALLRRLLEIRPDSAKTHVNVGATLYHLNRAEESLASFERALSLDPEHETARSGLERLKNSLGQGGE